MASHIGSANRRLACRTCVAAGPSTTGAPATPLEPQPHVRVPQAVRHAGRHLLQPLADAVAEVRLVLLHASAGLYADAYFDIRDLRVAAD